MAVGTAIAHNVAVHGVKPAAAADYLPYLKKIERKPQREDDMRETFEKICDIRGKQEREREDAR